MSAEDRTPSERGTGRSGAPDPGEAVRVVLVTAPNKETGEFLARELVEERLAACANVIPGLVSVYWWEDEIQRDDEALVIFKTRDDRVESLRERMMELHPYEVPEFLALPVARAHEAYARWILGEATGTKSED